MAFFRRKSQTVKQAPQPLPPTGGSFTTGIAAPPPIAAVEERVQAIGRELLDLVRQQRDSMFSARFWQDALIDWAMRDEKFKVQMFRFVDVFPMLSTPEQVHAHLVEYLTQPGVTLPPGLATAIKAGSFAKGMTTKTIASQITAMAGKFIAGKDASEAIPQLRELRRQGVAFSVDLLGEACVSDEESAVYRDRYLDLINTLSGEVQTWSPNDVLDRDHLGPIPRANVSIKISSLYPQTDPIDFDNTVNRLVDALSPILQAAAKQQVFINFDMEQHAFKDLTLALFMRCCEKFDFAAGLAMQAYLRSGDDDARRVIEWAKRTGRQVTVRLVKGAYWDYETIHAQQMHWPTPVWSRKADTDACFERMTHQFVEAIPTRADEGGVKLALGSHNIRSMSVALALTEKRGLPPSALEFQMLHGMAGPLKTATIERGLRLREYVPVGEMIPGMAYLVRRLLENTSNESWLRAGLREQASNEVLLRSPHGGEGSGAKAQPRDNGAAGADVFGNEPPRDFADAAQREAFGRAVRAARVERIASDATVEQADAVVATAAKAFPAWRDTPLHERSQRLRDVAAIMRQHRDELAAIMIQEAGKTWREADADVCEAIDFCEFYARDAIETFSPKRMGHYSGEINLRWYQGRGVAVVISPWNFPLAICTGMTVAALVSGNTVIVKPAEQTPYIAKRMCEMLWQAGMPRDVLHFLPGQGETVGAKLVRDPRVAIIAFTGSKAVGLDIIAAAGVTSDKQEQVKRVVCEMGGKNAIIVDSSADLDEAVIGVRDSAFGFAGQKCSACSRAIVLDDIYDTFVSRLVASTRTLRLGDPREPSTDIGPVIDDEAAAKIRHYIEIGKQEGRLALAIEPPHPLPEMPIPKPFVGPHIFTDIHPDHRLAQEEIFGPVLAVIRVKTFDEALAVANSTSYKLTGGLFSRTPSHLERAQREYQVGNLYLNRKITGALVGRQPFGGMGLSGAGSQAGGPDYLLHFVQPRVTTENTMRHGFAPMEE